MNDKRTSIDRRTERNRRSGGDSSYGGPEQRGTRYRRNKKTGGIRTKKNVNDNPWQILYNH